MLGTRAISKRLFLSRGPLKVIAVITLWSFLFTIGGGEVFLEFARAARTPLGFTSPNFEGVGSPGVSKELNINTFSLPQQLGKVKNKYNSHSDKIIIHIQDAHCNYDSQHKIADIVKYVNNEYGIKMVNLEGGSGSYDLSFFFDISKDDIRQKISDYFVLEGLVNGAEYFAINNPNIITLWGVEDKDLYIKNLKVFRDSLRNEKIINEYLNNLEFLINKLKPYIFSEELIQFDKKHNEYKTNNIEFKDYFSFILEKAEENDIRIRTFPNIYRLKESIKKEGEINFKKADNEREELINRLEKRLSKKEYKELVSKTKDFLDKNISQVDFYKYILEKVEKTGQNPKHFQEFKKFTIYLSLFTDADKSFVMKELSDLESKIIDILCVNNKQKQLYILAKNLTFIRNIFNISLTKEDYDYYKENRDLFNIINYIVFIREEALFYEINVNLNKNAEKLDEYCEKVIEFYEYSFERDKTFLKNIKLAGEKRKKGIIITGGFHSENLLEIFKKNNISYISIIPNFINKEGYINPYFSLLSGEMSSFVGQIETALSSLQLPSLWNKLGEEVEGYQAELTRIGLVAYDFLLSKNRDLAIRVNMKTKKGWIIFKMEGGVPYCDFVSENPDIEEATFEGNVLEAENAEDILWALAEYGIDEQMPIDNDSSRYVDEGTGELIDLLYAELTGYEGFGGGPDSNLLRRLLELKKVHQHVGDKDQRGIPLEAKLFRFIKGVSFEGHVGGYGIRINNELSANEKVVVLLHELIVAIYKGTDELASHELADAIVAAYVRGDKQILRELLSAAKPQNVPRLGNCAVWEMNAQERKQLFQRDYLKSGGRIRRKVLGLGIAALLAVGGEALLSQRFSPAPEQPGIVQICSLEQKRELIDTFARENNVEIVIADNLMKAYTRAEIVDLLIRIRKKQNDVLDKSRKTRLSKVVIGEREGFEFPEEEYESSGEGLIILSIEEEKGVLTMEDKVKSFLSGPLSNYVRLLRLYSVNGKLHAENSSEVIQKATAIDSEFGQSIKGFLSFMANHGEALKNAEELRKRAVEINEKFLMKHGFYIIPKETFEVTSDGARTLKMNLFLFQAVNQFQMTVEGEIAYSFTGKRFDITSEKIVADEMVVLGTSTALIDRDYAFYKALEIEEELAYMPEELHADASSYDIEVRSYVVAVQKMLALDFKDQATGEIDNLSAMTEKLTSNSIVHGTGHVVDSIQGLLTGEHNKSNREMASFLRQISLGLTPYYTFVQLAEIFLVDLNEKLPHTKAGQEIFQQVSNALNLTLVDKHGFQTSKFDIHNLQQITTVFETLADQKQTTERQLRDIAKEIFEENFGTPIEVDDYNEENLREILSPSERAGEVSTGSLIGKFYDDGNIIVDGFDIKDNEEGTAIIIRYEDKELAVVQKTKDDSGRYVEKSSAIIIDSLNKFLQQKGRSSLTEEEVERLGKILTMIGSVDKVVAVEDYRKGRESFSGYMDNRKGVLYLNKNIFDNPLALLHEMGEGFIEVPEKYRDQLTKHTYMRGVGKDIRIAYDALVKEIPDAQVEDMPVNIFIQNINRKLQKLGLRPDMNNKMTLSEETLIRYNGIQNRQFSEKNGIKKKQLLLFGLQDHLDPDRNLVFTLKLRSIREDLRRGGMNIHIIRDSNMGIRAKQRAVAKDYRKQSRKKYKIKEKVFYYHDEESLKEALEKAHAELTKPKNEEFTPQISININQESDLNIVKTEIEEQYERNANRFVIINDQVPSGEIDDYMIDEAKIIAVGDILCNDKRMVQQGENAADLMEMRKKQILFFQACGFFAEDDVVGNKWFQNGLVQATAEELAVFMENIVNGTVVLKITQINWQEIDNWNDAQKGILRSL